MYLQYNYMYLQNNYMYTRLLINSQRLEEVQASSLPQLIWFLCHVLYNRPPPHPHPSLFFHILSSFFFIPSPPSLPFFFFIIPSPSPLHSSASSSPLIPLSRSSSQFLTYLNFLSPFFFPIPFPFSPSSPSFSTSPPSFLLLRHLYSFGNNLPLFLSPLLPPSLPSDMAPHLHSAPSLLFFIFLLSTTSHRSRLL